MTPEITESEPAIDESAHLKDAEEFFSQKEASPEPAPKEPVVKEAPKDAAPKEPEKKAPVNPFLQTEETEKKEEPKTEVDIDKFADPDEKSKSYPDWKSLKQVAKEARAERDALRAEVEKMRTQTVPDDARKATEARLAELEAQNKAYSERLKLVDIRSHPDFVNEFVTPRENLLKEVTDTLKEYGVEADVAQILGADRKTFATKLSELASDLPEFERTNLFANANKFRELGAKASAVVADSSKYVEEKNQKFAAETRATFDAVAATTLSGIKPIAVPEGADDALKADIEVYNTALAGVRKTSEDLAFGRMDAKGVAQMAQEAAMFRFMRATGMPMMQKTLARDLSSRDARIAELEGQLKELQAAGPRTSYGSGSPEPSLGEKSHADAAAEFFPR